MISREPDWQGPPPHETPGEEATVTVGVYPSIQQAHEHAVVVLAMGLACSVDEDAGSGRYLLRVDADDARRVMPELEAYDRESAEAAQGPRSIPIRHLFRHAAGWPHYLVWAAATALVFLLQQRDPSFTGRFSSSSVPFLEQGEWWRPFTALFLHSDITHLVGNLFGAMFFVTFLSRVVGAPWAWLLTLACGTAANALSLLLHASDPFSSIGASTAVFAALGLLSGLGFAATFHLHFAVNRARAAAPVLAGVVLLGWMGGGSPGDNTDVLGHVLGFVCGLVTGFAAGVCSDTAKLEAVD
ncbi:MAG: rhomboid family intramembrane serine protease [Akkermansiaceae bacterium]|nr:rhomboid family intramembrane serine protease [Akkermansiaceae bacterium]